MKTPTIIAVLLLATAPLARAEPLLPVPTFPEPKPQAGAPPATSGGYLTCSIAMYCLGHDGKWTPEPAAAEPMPVPKPPGPGGSCPHGYTSSGSFCVPGEGAQDAIAKPPNGTCPWGWIASGSYCLRSVRR